MSVVCVSSATNLSASRDVALTGATKLVSLGLENVVPASATMYYNLLSIGILFLIGSLSSSRNTRFFAVLLPLFAAILVYFEWLQGTNPVQTYGIIVMCMILAAAVYMKDSLRERFGVGGPGSMVINIMIFLILFQTVVGVVNMTGLWEGNAAPSPENQYSYQNFDLSKQVPVATNTGGLLGDIASTLGAMSDMLLSGLRMFLALLVSIGAFSVVLGSVYPWMVTNPDGTVNTFGVAILGVIQVAIWMIYVKFIYDTFVKPPIGVSDF